MGKSNERIENWQGICLSKLAVDMQSCASSLLGGGHCVKHCHKVLFIVDGVIPVRERPADEVRGGLKAKELPAVAS